MLEALTRISINDGRTNVNICAPRPWPSWPSCRLHLGFLLRICTRPIVYVVNPRIPHSLECGMATGYLGLPFDLEQGQPEQTGPALHAACYVGADELDV